MPAEKTVSIRMPDGLLAEIDREVEYGEYSGRSDFIKAAVRTLLQMNYERRVRNADGVVPTEAIENAKKGRA